MGDPFLNTEESQTSFAGDIDHDYASLLDNFTTDDFGNLGETIRGPQNDDNGLHNGHLYLETSDAFFEPPQPEQSEELFSQTLWSQLTRWDTGNVQDHVYQTNAGPVMPPPHPQIELAQHDSITPATQAESNQDAQLHEKSQRRLFTSSQVFLLESWLKTHLNNPYPGPDDKIFLVMSTGLTMKQVEAWFSRTRQRKIREVYVDESQNRASITGSANSSLDVLRSSLPDDERSLQDAIARWSDSHLLPYTPRDSEQSVPLERWAGSHMEWWFLHLPSEITAPKSVVSRTPFFDPDDHFHASLQDDQVWDPNPIRDDISTSSWAASSGPRERSLYGDGAWSCGSSVSGFSKFSATSHSSRPYPVGRKSSRGHRGAISRKSSASFNSNSRKAPGLSNSFTPTPNLPSIYKRRKLAESTTSFVSVGSHCSEYSRVSQGRRQGRRLSDLPVPSTPSTPRRPDDDFWCTFCDKTFKDAYRWQRHEEAVHCPNKVWTCRPRASDFTEAVAPNRQWLDMCSHAATVCWSKPAAKRTFFRKDAVIQHLSLVHKNDYGSDQLNDIADELEVVVSPDAEQLLCPFCQQICSTWIFRMSHIRIHFASKTAIWPFERISIPKSWQKTLGVCATVLTDVEPFVQAGKSLFASHPLQWRCPACSYTTYASLSIPYVHTCEHHWDQLHDFSLEALHEELVLPPNEVCASSHPHEMYLTRPKEAADTQEISNVSLQSSAGSTLEPRPGSLKGVKKRKQQIRGWRNSIMLMVRKSRNLPVQSPPLASRKRRSMAGDDPFIFQHDTVYFNTEENPESAQASGLLMY